MRRIKFGVLILLSIYILTGCSGGPFSSNPDPDDEHTADTPDISESLPSQPKDSQESEPPAPEGMARSPLTNEWINEDAALTRPIAVMTPNESNALPQYGLSQASVLYEASVEGYMSRLLAIYEDWQDLEKIGNVRSLRTYYAYWAFEWDAFVIHCGHPYFVDEIIARPETQTINEANYVDSVAFYRDETRRKPHNAYTTGQGILTAVNKKDYPLEYRGLTDQNHFLFAEDNAANTLEQYGDAAKTAVYIDLSGCYPLTRCYFDYNEEDGLYYRSQHLSGGPDGPHLDASGQQLTFRNVLVQYVKYEDLGNGYYAFQCQDDTEDGWFFTNGRGIHITWKKESDYGATRFYDDQGNEIALNTGKTMICVALKDSKFTFR